MEKSRLKTIVISLAVIVPLGLVTLVLFSEYYKDRYTETQREAAVTKFGDEYFIVITKMRPVVGPHELNPFRWIFPAIIEESLTLKVSKIEGVINADRIFKRHESEEDFTGMRNNGTIEFTRKNELIVKFSSDGNEDYSEWNGKYYLKMGEVVDF